MRLRRLALIVVRILMGLLFPAMLLPRIYARQNPQIAGVPFFYWYMIACLAATSMLIATAYWLDKEARGANFAEPEITNSS